MGIAVLTVIVVFLAQLPGDASTAITAGAVDFTSMVLRLESLYITTAAYVLIQGLSQLKATQNEIVYRLKPFAPALLTTGMAFLPSFRLGAWDETLLYGLSLGAFIGWGHKLLKRTIFGGDQAHVDDSELQKLIDEYFAAKTKRSLKARFEDLLT